jgi:hypothetical protein
MKSPTASAKSRLRLSPGSLTVASASFNQKPVVDGNGGFQCLSAVFQCLMVH